MPEIEAWLQGAMADAARTSRDGLGPVLEALAQAALALRRAAWNASAATPGAAVSDAGRSPESPDRRG